MKKILPLLLLASIAGCSANNNTITDEIGQEFNNNVSPNCPVKITDYTGLNQSSGKRLIYEQYNPKLAPNISKDSLSNYTFIWKTSEGKEHTGVEPLIEIAEERLNKDVSLYFKENNSESKYFCGKQIIQEPVINNKMSYCQNGYNPFQMWIQDKYPNYQLSNLQIDYIRGITRYNDINEIKFKIGDEIITGNGVFPLKFELEKYNPKFFYRNEEYVNSFKYEILSVNGAMCESSLESYDKYEFNNVGVYHIYDHKHPNFYIDKNNKYLKISFHNFYVYGYEVDIKITFKDKSNYIVKLPKIWPGNHEDKIFSIDNINFEKNKDIENGYEVYITDVEIKNDLINFYTLYNNVKIDSFTKNQ